MKVVGLTCRLLIVGIQVSGFGLFEFGVGGVGFQELGETRIPGFED